MLDLSRRARYPSGMKTLRLLHLLVLQLLLLAMATTPAQAQTPSYVPTPVSAYINNGSSWGAWTAGSGTGTIPTAPVAIALYCQTPTSTAWSPCNPSGGSFTPAGVWSSTTNYGAGYVVTYNGILYYSLRNGNLNYLPSTFPAWWSPLALAPGGAVVPNPTTNQTITQPVGTQFTVNNQVAYNLTVRNLLTVFPNASLSSNFFGDSICVGSGTTTPGGAAGLTYNAQNTLAWTSLLAAEVGGTSNNYCYGGSMTADAVTAQMFTAANYNPSATTTNPLVVVNPGANDVLWCDIQSGSVVAGCQKNQGYAYRTLLTWPATTNKYYGNQWTVSAGAPTTDTRLPSYASLSMASGTHWTMNFAQAPNTTGLCVAWEALAGTTGGMASFSIDGVATDTLQAYGYSGQTVQTGYVGSTWTVWTQCYPDTPGVHKLDVVTTNSSAFALVAALAPTDPATATPGSPRVIGDGVNYYQADGYSTNTAFYNAQNLTNVTTLAGYGFPVVFANVRAFTDLPCDWAPTTYTETNGTVCTGSTQAGAHPGDHGHLDIYRANKSALALIGGASHSGPMVSEANYPLSTEQYASVNNIGLSSQIGLNPGLNVFSGSAGGRNFGIDLGYVNPGITPPQGGTVAQSYMTRLFAPTGNYIASCFYADSATAPTAQSQFTCSEFISPGGITDMVALYAPSLQTSGNIESTTGIVAAGGSLIALPLGAATSASNFNSALLQVEGAYWNGTVNSPDYYYWQDVVGTGTSPATVDTLFHTGSTGSVGVSIPFPITTTSLAATGPITGSNVFASTPATISSMGSGLTVTCVVSSCTNRRGILQLTSTTFSTGNMVTLTWAATPTAPVCQVIQDGGTTYIGAGTAGSATTTTLSISNAVSITGTTQYVGYECVP